MYSLRKVGTNRDKAYVSAVRLALSSTQILSPATLVHRSALYITRREHVCLSIARNRAFLRLYTRITAELPNRIRDRIHS